MSRYSHHHPPCRCGCGELADECAGPNPNPLGSMTLDIPDPNPYANDETKDHA